MSAIKLPLLLASLLLLLLTRPAQAQVRDQRPEPATTEVQVRVVVPATLVTIRDYAAILLSKDQDRLQTLAERGKRKTPKREISFPVTLPSTWVRKLMAEN